MPRRNISVTYRQLQTDPVVMADIDIESSISPWEETLSTKSKVIKVITGLISSLVILCLLVTASVLVITQHHTSKTTENFSIYHSLSEINDLLNNWAQTNPNIVKLRSIGTTFEGRPILAVEILPRVVFNKSTVTVLECGVHAREWISPASCIWIADQVIKHRSSRPIDPKFFQFISPEVESSTLAIIPVLNPDGYDFSWRSPDDYHRYWRKNRSRNNLLYAHTYNWDCNGTDLNRNFGVGWNPTPPWDDSVPSPCEPTYSGPTPFSEKETQALRSYVADLKQRFNKVTAYFSVHAISQFWMYPYAYTTNNVSNDSDLKVASEKAVNAIESLYGTKYKFGPVSKTYKVVGGVTVDYMYQEEGIKYTFGVELRPERHSDPYGYDGYKLPPEEIVPTAQELWAGIATVLGGIQN